jgi:hypothetical protein
VNVISLRTADVHQSGQISKKATAKMLTLATDAKSGGKCSTVPFFSSLSWARLFEKTTFHPFCETHNLPPSLDDHGEVFAKSAISPRGQKKVIKKNNRYLFWGTMDHAMCHGATAKKMTD